MTWSQDGFDAAFESLCERFASASFPAGPDGFIALSPARPMRSVLRGTVETARGPRTVVVKWHKPVRVGDHVSRRIRGGKGTREGKVLRALARAGVRVPDVLGYAGDPDLCVTAYRDDLRPLTIPVPAPFLRDVVRDVATQLGMALDAGLSARDLHPGNLGWSDDGAVLVDLGSAKIDPRTDLIGALAQWRYGLGQHLGATQRYRALRQVLRAAGRDPHKARGYAPRIESAARVLAARHRRGRDRRATRDGKHFEQVKVGTIPGIRSGVRRKAWRGPSARDAAVLLGPVDGAVPLKADGSVFRVDHNGQSFVVKRYAAPPGAKPPRPLRAFRRAFAMENRLVPGAIAQLALVADDGSGVLVSSLVPGHDLHAWFHDPAGYTALPFRRRRAALEALGRMLRAMHDEGIAHRDLKAPNLMWHDDGSLAGAFVIVDHDGARVVGTDVSWKRRARNVARLDASLPASRVDRLRVLRAYRRVWPFPPIPERTMADWIAKHVRRKRGPSGVPR